MIIHKQIRFSNESFSLDAKRSKFVYFFNWKGWKPLLCIQKKNVSFVFIMAIGPNIFQTISFQKKKRPIFWADNVQHRSNSRNCFVRRIDLLNMYLFAHRDENICVKGIRKTIDIIIIVLVSPFFFEWNHSNAMTLLSCTRQCGICVRPKDKHTVEICSKAHQKDTKPEHQQQQQMSTKKMEIFVVRLCGKYE